MGVQIIALCRPLALTLHSLSGHSTRIVIHEACQPQSAAAKLIPFTHKFMIVVGEKCFDRVSTTHKRCRLRRWDKKENGSALTRAPVFVKTCITKKVFSVNKTTRINSFDFRMIYPPESSSGLLPTDRRCRRHRENNPPNRWFDRGWRCCTWRYIRVRGNSNRAGT